MVPGQSFWGAASWGLAGSRVSLGQSQVRGPPGNCVLLARGPPSHLWGWREPWENLSHTHTHIHRGRHTQRHGEGCHHSTACLSKTRNNLCVQESGRGSGILGFPGDSVVKNPLANAGDVTLTPGSGRCPGEGNGNPLQYFCMKIP